MGSEQGDLPGQGSPEDQLELGVGDAHFKKGNSKPESGQERMATPGKTSGPNGWSVESCCGGPMGKEQGEGRAKRRSKGAGENFLLASN